MSSLPWPEMSDDKGVSRRVGLGLGAATGLSVAGVLLLSMAASGAGPAAYPVVLGGSATPVAPVTATPSAGQALVFVNTGSEPYVVTRTATPFPLDTTIAPSSSSTPFTVPTVLGSYPYQAQLRQPANILGMAGSAGPTISAQVVVAPPTSAAAVAPAPTTATAPATGPATAAPVLTSAATARRSSTPTKPRRRSSPSVKASASASATSVAIQPGGVLPQPAQPPLFSDGVAVPLPVLPTAVPSDPAVPTPPPVSDDAGIAPSAPVATDSTMPLAVGPIAADAPRMGPRRSRGLPIALALVLLLGVGGGVVRTAAGTRRTR